MTDLTEAPFDQLSDEDQERAALEQQARDRVCGYEDPFGGPCVLPVEGHPVQTRKGRERLIHDDGRNRG